MPSNRRAALLNHWAERLGRLRDPRAINPIYVFAAGLSVVLPIWLIFLNR